jgi:TolB protein
VSERRDERSGRPWSRAWLVTGLAAWALLGVLLVNRANQQGLVEDISFSPYHVVGYAALLALAIYVVWTFFRAFRHGTWRTAFPPLYGGLGLALVLLVAWVILDPIWRETLGINPGIEGGLAPPRLLIPVALVLIASGPLREAVAERMEPGLRPGELAVRWAGVVSTGLIGAALTLVAFNPVQLAVNDWRVLPGVDNSEIWTMSADGSAQTRLIEAAGDGVDYSLPAWSPDGARIAYTVWTNEGGVGQNVRNEDQTSAVWTMAADGSDRRLVVDGAPDQAWNANFSPDGVWLAYVLSRQGPPPAGDVGPQANPAPGQVGPPGTISGSSLWMVRLDGSGQPVRLTPDGVEASGPAWSPDGSMLAYGGTSGGNGEIYVARVSETGLTGTHPVAEDPGNDWGPAWLPDGEHLLFTSNRSGNDEIWRAPLGGSLVDVDTVRLTDDAAGDWVPAVSPDGRRIAFASDRSGDADVWSMAADGSEPVNLTRHPGNYDGTWSVAWSPDGKRLVYAAGPFQDASSSGWVREDFAAAQALILGIALAVIALLVVALGAPPGSFAVVLGIVVTAAAIPSDEWRFIPGAIAAGLVIDLLLRAVPARRRARVAAAATPALANLALGLTIGAGGTLAWSVTLLLGVVVASGIIGWALAEAVERLLLHRPGPEVVPVEE